MSKMNKLIALVIFSCFGISYGAEYDIKTITTIMDAYEAQIDSIKLKYSYESFVIDKKGNRDLMKGSFAKKNSEGYVLLDERTQKGKTWDDDKEPEGTARSFNGQTTRYLTHKKNKHGYHSAALYEEHRPNLYKTRDNPYYHVWHINYKTKITDLLNDPDGMAKIQGEEIVNGLKTIKINFKMAENLFDCHLWLLPEKNYLPIKTTIYRIDDGSRIEEMHWSEFKEFAGGIWYPMNIKIYYRDVDDPCTIKIEEMDISPLTKEDFEFEFPAFTSVTDHILGTSYLTTATMEQPGIEQTPLESSLSNKEKEEVLDNAGTGRPTVRTTVTKCEFEIYVTDRTNLPVSNAKIYRGLNFSLDGQTQKFSRVASQVLAQSNSGGIVKLEALISDHGMPVVIVDESTQNMSCILLKRTDAEKVFKVELMPPMQIVFQLQINKDPIEKLDIELMPSPLTGNGSYSGVLNYDNVDLARETPANLELICPFYAGKMKLSIEGIAIDRFTQVIPEIVSSGFLDLGILELKVKHVYEIIKKEPPSLEISEWVKGKPVELDDLKGKVVLLDFWALWCAPCIRGFPYLNYLHKEYERDGLVIIAIHDISKQKKEILNVAPSKLDMSEVPFRVAIDKLDLATPNPQKEAGLSFSAYDISKLPTKILISREGIVECYDPPNLENRIKTLLYGNAMGKTSTNSLIKAFLYVAKENKTLIPCSIGLSVAVIYLIARFANNLKKSRIKGVKE